MAAHTQIPRTKAEGNRGHTPSLPARTCRTFSASLLVQVGNTLVTLQKMRDVLLLRLLLLLLLLLLPPGVILLLLLRLLLVLILLVLVLLLLLR